eukprot:1158758-Pelagomonas_calceolata.AAC.8
MPFELTPRLASSPGPWAGTAKQGLKGRGDSLHSTMSNQSRQSKTVNQACEKLILVQRLSAAYKLLLVRRNSSLHTKLFLAQRASAAHEIRVYVCLESTLAGYAHLRPP